MREQLKTVTGLDDILVRGPATKQGVARILYGADRLFFTRPSYDPSPPPPVYDIAHQTCQDLGEADQKLTKRSIAVLEDPKPR